MMSENLSCHLETLGLSSPVSNSLVRAGLRTVGDVTQLTEAEISALKWMPAGGPKEVMSALEYIGVSLSEVSHGGIAALTRKSPAPSVKDEHLPTAEDFRIADDWISDASNAAALRSIAEDNGLSFCYLVGKLPVAASALQESGKSDNLLQEIEWYAGELAADFTMLHGGLK